MLDGVPVEGETPLCQHESLDSAEHQAVFHWHDRDLPVERQAEVGDAS